jgi:uncharacterized protein DUF4268
LQNLYKEETHKVFGELLVRDELEGKNMSMLYIKEESHVSDRSDWNNQFGWFKENIEALDKFLRPLIKKL